MNKNSLHSDLTGIVLRAYYTVYNTLGYGFLEKVYENAMMIELKELGLECVSQKGIKVFYKGSLVGKYASDILVSNAVIVELKAARTLSPDHTAQLLNYLKATKHEVGLLLNFGVKPEFERRVYANEFK